MARHANPPAQRATPRCPARQNRAQKQRCSAEGSRQMNENEENESDGTTQTSRRAAAMPDRSTRRTAARKRNERHKRACVALAHRAYALRTDDEERRAVTFFRAVAAVDFPF